MMKTRVDVDQMRQELEEYYSSESPQDKEALQSLQRLAEELTHALPPTRPRQEFRRRLREELVAVVRERPGLIIASGPESRRRIWLVGATLGSLLPLFGVLAYLLRSRLTGKPQHAASH